MGEASAHGKSDIEELARAVLQTYPDGTPRTRHVTTNLIIESEEDAGTATSRSYFTIFQQVGDFPLQRRQPPRQGSRMIAARRPLVARRG